MDVPNRSVVQGVSMIRGYRTLSSPAPGGPSGKRRRKGECPDFITPAVEEGIGRGLERTARRENVVDQPDASREAELHGRVERST